MKTQTLAPAQLWIGSQEIVLGEVMNYLQQLLCSNNNCNLCTTCMQLRAQQHHAVLWLCPEKQYALEDLEIIQEKLAFSLGETERFFFVLQKADYLTKQCANSLLKSIEEPPAGYTFILCAERIENVLTTIQSRCTVRSLSRDQSSGEHHELYAFFASTPGLRPADPLTFLTYIQKSTLHEIDSIELIDKLLGFWIKKYMQNLAQENDHAVALRNIQLLKNALVKPPMPGGSKLFWKNLYIQFYA